MACSGPYRCKGPFAAPTPLEEGHCESALTGAGTVTANASTYGGNGGSAQRAGNTGGAGGSASVVGTRATSTGDGAVSADAYGGTGDVTSVVSAYGGVGLDDLGKATAIATAATSYFGIGELSVTINGYDIFDETFSSASDLLAAFTDDAIDLGSLTASFYNDGGTNDLAVMLTVDSDSDSAGSGFYGNVILGDPTKSSAAASATTTIIGGAGDTIRSCWRRRRSRAAT